MKNLKSLAATLVMLMCCATMSAQVASGTCGSNLTWSLSQDGVLVIEGMGAMTDYSGTTLNNKYVTSAPWNAYLAEIKEIVVKENVTTIGKEAFRGTSALEVVNLPDGLTKIGQHAFARCEALVSVNIPSTITSIENGSFYYCGLTTLQLPNSVKTIGESAFTGNEFYSIEFPEGLVEIGVNSFCDCDGLKRVIIPNSVTTIAREAFDVCEELEVVSIGNGVTSIGDDAFNGCGKLSSVVCSAIVPPSLGSNAFKSISSGAILYVAENSVSDYKSSQWNEYFSTIQSNTSGPCGDNVTWRLSESGVLTIEGTGAMLSSPWQSYNENITSVIIGDGVTSIVDEAFIRCSNLTTVNFGNGLQIIGKEAFNGCQNISSLVLPSTLTTIGDHAFAGCGSFSSIIIPKSVTNIGNGPFAACCFTSISVEDGNLNFDSRNNCNALIRTATNSLVHATSSTIIPEGITCIEYGAFGGCSNLSSIVIPNSVTSIEPYAFEACGELTSITLSENLCSIGEGAFLDCTKLKEITIPASVTSIGGAAFNACYNLASITCEALVPPTFGESAKSHFSVSASTPVYVPATSLEAYQTADVWKEFTNIQPIASIIASGTCGSKLTWNLMDNGVLVIEGIGAMTNYSSSSAIPWFSYIDNITSVIIKEGVTNICNSAFDGCRSLTSLTPPEGVTSIGSSAFDGCSSITCITLPESLTSIGDSAFRECRSLTSITLPEGVTRIGSYAFYGCSSLTAIILPEGVTSIGNYAFYGCSSLTSITIPESVTSIGSSAFYGCGGKLTVNCNIPSASSLSQGVFYNSNFTKVTIGEGVTSIGSYAFYICRSLTSITLPSSVTSIGSSAFYGCSSLTAITIPESVTSIESYAFDGCSSLTSITLPEGVTSIGNAAFRGCSSLAAITLPSSVTSIGSGAFYGCSSLTSITLPEGVTSIGSSAFYGCSSLTVINIPEGVTSIGNSAFYNCSSLTSINIPSSVTSIGSGAFYNCSSLTAITIPEGVTSIGEKAFYNAFELVYINATTPPTLSSSSDFIFDYGVLVVPESAYEIYCTADFWKDDVLRKKIVTKEDYKKVVNLTAKEDVSALYETIGEARLPRVADLTISGSINSYDFFVMLTKMTGLRHLDLTDATIVKNAFCHYQTYSTQDNVFPDYGLYNCKFRSIKLPKNITKINAYAFNKNPLNEVAIPSSVTSIGNYAFNECNKLTSISIPDNSQLASIGGSAFSGCSSLISINFPAKMQLTSIGQSAFTGCISLNSITLPEGVTTINSHAFYACSKLSKVVLPPTIKTIGGYAFCNCSFLEEIRIPSSVRSVGDYAFYGCSSLNDVYVYTIEPINVAQATFPKNGNNFIGTLHAPKVSYTNYYFDTQWGQFLKFAEFDEPYDNFYVEGDKEFNDSTGSVGGTPDVEMGGNSGIIVDGDTIKQDLGDVDIEHDGCHGGSIIVGGNGHIHAGKLHFHIHIKAGKWYFFCFPFDIKKKDIFCQGGADWIFRYYDGEERASNGKGGWKNVTSDGNGNHLKAAVGYIFQASKDDVLELIVDEKTIKKEDKYNELVAHITSNKHDASWNFVGNPYLSYYQITEKDYSAPITIWDGSKYKAVRPGDDDYILNPFEAFFVQKPDGEDKVSYNSDNQLTYNQSQTAAANARARRREQAIDPDRLLVNISLTDGEETDQTRVVFNNNAAMDYEAACDAAKFSTAGVPQLYTIDSRAVKYAINERPVAEGIVTMGYSVPVQGNYTLSAPRMDTPISVKDNLTGTIHNFAEGDYVFASEAGTFDDRFTVLMESATGIDNAELGKEKSEMYNIKGQRVENANEQGVYIKDNRKVVKL